MDQPSEGLTMGATKLPTGPVAIIEPGSMTRGELPQNMEQQLSISVSTNQPEVPPPSPPPPPPAKTHPWAKWVQEYVLKYGLPASIAGVLGFGFGGGGGAATKTDLKQLEKRVDDLEPLVKVVDDAYHMSALALEIAVESDRYQTDLLVSIAQLIDPSFKPDDKDVNLQKRLRQGRQVVDSIGVSRP